MTAQPQAGEGVRAADANAVGVLVMSYGTPESMDGIEAYYTHIRRGRPPSREQLEELTARYAAIGGVFPLREHTNRQAQGLLDTLARMRPEMSFIGFQGLKHARPFIEDGVRAAAERGLVRLVGVVLAPHYSAMSVGEYIARARREAEARCIRASFVKQYHLHPKLVRAFAERVRRALERHFAGVPRDRVRVVFTAHSLPERILADGDPYPQQVEETARAVAEASGVANWEVGWQSAGRTPEPWLGPDILDILARIRAEGGDAVLVCPVGFVSDHLEVLYDLDIEAKRRAEALGIRFARTESLNDDPLYLEALAECVLSVLEEAP